MRRPRDVALCVAVLAGGAAGCASIDSGVRAALADGAGAIGKARCGAPIARSGAAEIVERTGDDRWGGGRAIVRGTTAAGEPCSGDVLFSYLRRDTQLGLSTGAIEIQNAVVVGQPAGTEPAGTPAGALAIGTPHAARVASEDGDLYTVDLEVGRAVTLLARGAAAPRLDVLFGGDALDLHAAGAGMPPLFVPPASGRYTLRVRGEVRQPYIVTILAGGVAGQPHGWAPASMP
jgi:hypothetical protein